MSWRPWLEDRALRQMQGLPTEAFDILVQTLVRICDDPYDPVFSAPVPPVPGRRVADLGDFGFIEFIADEAKGLVRVLSPGVDRLAIATSPRSATRLTVGLCRAHDPAISRAADVPSAAIPGYLALA